MVRTIIQSAADVFPWGALYMLLAAAALGLLVATPVPALALAVPAAVVFMFLLWKYPQLFVLAIIVLVPLNAWQSVSRQFSFLSISKVVGVAVLPAIAYRCTVRREPPLRMNTALILCTVVFMAISALKTINTITPAASLHAARLLFQSLVFVFVIVYFGRSAAFIRACCAAVVAGAIISSAVATTASVFNITSLTMQAGQANFDSARVIGAETDPNILAAGLLCALPYIAHFMAQARQRRSTLLWAAGFALVTAAIILTYSRAVILVLFAVLALVAARYVRRMNLRHLGFAVAAACMALAVLMKTVPDSPLLDRLSSLATPSTNRSLSRRMSYVIVGMRAITQKPLWGWGLGSYPELFSRTPYAAAYAGRAEGFFRQAHNLYLQMAVETGAAGLAAFLLVITGCLITFIKVNRSTMTALMGNDGLAGSMALSFFAFLLCLLFLSIPHHKFLWLHIGLGLALDQHLQTARRAAGGECLC